MSCLVVAFKLLRQNGLDNFVTTALLAPLKQAGVVVTKLSNASCLVVAVKLLRQDGLDSFVTTT